MFKSVQFPAEVQELVRLVEETDPDRIIEATLAKLRSGVSAKEMLRAGALAVVRSTELPPEHHGGPVHPICGIHAVYHTSQRLSGELAYVPIVQHTALCNNHIHSPQMGPYIMPEIEAMEGSASEVGSFHLSDAYLTGDLAPKGGVKDSLGDTQEAFLKSIRAKKPSAAEHYVLWLLEHLSPGEVLDLMMPTSISRNNMDDHYFIYPVFTARALDCIGWEWAPFLMRPAVRYLARNPSPLGVEKPLDFSTVEALLDEYRLLEIDIPLHSTDRETEAIGELGARIGSSRDYYDTLEPIARALADGLSLEGAGEALSIGAATAYLSTSYGNPMDSHLHTGTNTRRYLLNMEGVSLRNKLLALLTGMTGPEVLVPEGLMNWTANTDPETSASLPERSQNQLLDAIGESIESQPWSDWRGIGVANLIAPDEVKGTVALARQYSNLGYDPEVFFAKLAEINCRDDFTEMHALKHFQATVDEFYSTRKPFRSVHLL
ncbi:MAG: hypothetical protein ACE5KI_08670, partial [Dehalococcoidia bacterium]